MTIALIAFAVLQVQVPTLDELIARHVEAAGGREAIGKVTAVARKGCFQPGGRGRCLPSEAYSKDGGKWQFRMWVPNVLAFEQGSDGRKAWSHEPEETSDIPEKDRREQEWAFDAQLPLHLAEQVKNPKPASKQTIDGREVWVVDAEGASLHFDAGAGLLLRAGAVGVGDYRVVDGVKLPFEIRFITPRGAQVLKLDEVKLNVPVEDSRFDRAASAAAYKRDMDAIWMPQLEAGLKGIDPGQARPMLEKLRNFAPEDGRMLYDFIVQHGYQRVVEIGTARGNSALWMAMALRKTGGKLVTIEMNAELAKTATENFAKAGLGDVADCRNNDAFKEIPGLQGDFEMVFLDTGTRLHKNFLDAVYARVVKGGAVVSHNANEFEAQQPDFLKAITSDPRLETTIRKTDGGGFSFSVKRS